MRSKIKQMNQLIFNLKTGQLAFEAVPVPQVGPGPVLIRSRRSLVSPGTGRMLVNFGRGSLLSKAQQQPERVRQVVDKIKTDGLRPTINAIRRRLDQPVPLGYCNTGEVLAEGRNITDLCIDPDENRCQLARMRGIMDLNPAEIDVAQAVRERTGHVGADGVVMAASLESGEIMAQAARKSRQRGRVVVPGVVPMHLNRADFFAKELTVQLSHSYGPGRYDAQYEQYAQDYPIGHVLWTENRDFQEILRLLSDKKLRVDDLIADVVSLNEFADVYAPKSQRNAIATLFSYPDTIDLSPVVQLREPRFLGSTGELSATRLARKYGIAQSTSDYRQILDNRPIALCDIIAAQQRLGRTVTVGFNRNFSPFVQKIKALLGGDASNEVPMNVVATMNAGGTPPIPFTDSMNATQMMLAALQSGRESGWVAVATPSQPVVTTEAA